MVRFAYNNGGRRDVLKIMSEVWTDGYITPNAELKATLYCGFEGANGKKSLSIKGNDSTITTPLGGSPLGDEPLGTTPIGGDNLDPLTGLPGTNTIMNRFWQADTASFTDYTEHFIEYKMDSYDGQFALVSYGTNQTASGTAIISHKK